MARPYRVISGDSHLELKPERWTPFVEARYRDRAPRTVQLPNGGDAFLVEGRPPIPAGLNVQGGREYEDFDPVAVVYDGTPGTGTPEQRMKELDQDGVDAEVLFQGLTGPESTRSIKHLEAYRAMIRGWNDWLAKEYCAAGPDRLLGVGNIPSTNVKDAMAELEHCKELGLPAVALSAYPSGANYPMPEDDEFWAESLKIGMPVAIHVALRTASGPAFGPGAVTSFNYGKPLLDDSGPGGPDYVRSLAAYGMRGALNATQMVMSGLFDRFPQLQVYFAENEAGWVPMYLEDLDNRYLRHRGWAKRHYGMPYLDRLPSEYVTSHVTWGFLRDPLGVRLRDEMGGAAKLMWGVDFPHYNSDWPKSREMRDTNFVGVSAEERYEMECGNVIRYFKLKDSVDLPD